MLQAAYRAQPGAAPSIHVFDGSALDWQPTAQAGLRLKPVRYDDELGQFLGWVTFEPFSRSGLHQHRGVATSFVVDGGLTDYHGSLGLHQVGINLAGATHDAMAYQHTVLVSRLEGPVVYPPTHGDLSGLHAGSRHADVVNAAPDVPPEINVAVDALPVHETGIAAVRRQMIFDYAGTGSAHRFVQLHLGPGAQLPPWRAGALTELWVRGGRLELEGRGTVLANSFVLIEPGAEVQLSAPFGALVLAWAQASEQWLAPPPRVRAVRPSLFGF
jgi:hypothetical protein